MVRRLGDLASDEQDDLRIAWVSDTMTDFIRFFVKVDLWPMLQWLPVLPVFMLPVAPLVWLLMVAIGFAPMTWGGFFFNWLVVSVIFEAWFVYKRLRSNW